MDAIGECKSPFFTTEEGSLIIDRDVFSTEVRQTFDQFLKDNSSISRVPGDGSQVIVEVRSGGSTGVVDRYWGEEFMMKLRNFIKEYEGKDRVEVYAKPRGKELVSYVYPNSRIRKVFFTRENSNPPKSNEVKEAPRSTWKERPVIPGIASAFQAVGPTRRVKRQTFEVLEYFFWMQVWDVDDSDDQLSFGYLGKFYCKIVFTIIWKGVQLWEEGERHWAHCT